jgi:hypothetical protein
MSATGLKVPKVEVERWKEALLTLDGKRCAPAGLKHLPGTTGRSMSTGVLAGPGTTAQTLRRQNSSRHRREESRRRKQIRRNPAQAPWNDPCFTSSAPGTPTDAVGRPSTSPCISVPGQATESSETKLEVPLGKGGYIHGSKIMEPDPIGYDPVKHGWYHPKGRAVQAKLKASGPEEYGSWEWDIRKAKDHIGFPARDVGRGHVIKTHVSNAGPDWFLSVKMDRAPNGGSRLPACAIKSDTTKPQESVLCMKSRIFEKGPNLSVRERGVERPSTATSIPGSVRSISVPKQADRPASAPTGSLFNTAPGQTSVTFDDWRGTYQDHLNTGNRCQHGSKHCDFHPCHSHQGWRTRSDMVAGSAVMKQKRAPNSTYVGIDARYPGPNDSYC